MQSRTFVRNKPLLCTLASVLLAFISSKTLCAQVVINEIMASNSFTIMDEDGDSSDWVELYNGGQNAVDLADYALTDDSLHLNKWIFPQTIINPNSYILVWCSGKDRIDVSDEMIVERDSTIPFVDNLISLDDEWKYLTDSPEAEGPPPDWMSQNYDDSSWQSGKPGFGFGRSEDLSTELEEDTGALFLRRAFTFSPGQTNLVLQMQFDDGFVAYLNGVRVAEYKFPEDEDPVFSSTATGSHSARYVERFDLTPWLDLLTPGENQLALAVLNVSHTSNDMFMLPELGNIPPILHTNYKLEKSGEEVLLVNPAGVIEDAVFYPDQHEDQSYGRSPNGTGPFLYNLVPSPLSGNEGPASENPLVVADTKFSINRGFFYEPFQLEITSATSGALVRYTLDGTEPTLENGLDYTEPLLINRTTTVRAAAFKSNSISTNVDAHTYIFLDDVVLQDLQATLGYGFPARWGSVVPDYGMDPRVIGANDLFGGIYSATIHDDLLSLPTMSIVMNIDDMFGVSGIYTNSTMEGVAWERPASVELIYPDNTTGFQENCGIRIQGGWFRSHSGTKKHSLRLLFKNEYGPTKLEYELFGDDAVNEFDTITLRAGANDGYSWSAARLTEQYVRDNFGRSLQRATGNAGAHGMFVHLYINGIYWGLYNPVERPDRSFSASYYGGDKDLWDSVHDGVSTNGTLQRWNEMIQMTSRARTSPDYFQQLQGRNPDGTPNPEYPHLLDVPNYIDYLIVNIWGGNWDWPWKNWWAARSNTDDSTGFKFYCWDYENTMGNNRSRSPLSKNALQNNFSSAGVPHQNLRSNPEYRLLFADRIHKFFFNDGLFDPESLISRYEEVATSVERAIVAESARWGDQHHYPPLTLNEWENELNWITQTYLPQRSDIVLQQFRSAQLYPDVAAPVFNHSGGFVDPGFQLVAYAPAGITYYSIDGSDPRLPDGSPSPSAEIFKTGEKAVLVPVDAMIRYHIPAESLGSEWIEPGFNDASWIQAQAPIGYDTSSSYDEMINTNVLEDMHEINSSLYLRIYFEVDDPAYYSFLTLNMRYDDGFVLYINGEHVASRKAPETLEWDSRSLGSHAASLIENIEINSAREFLQPGLNVLAIHGLNSRSTNRDFFIQAELLATDTVGSGIVIDQSAHVSSRTLIEDEWSPLAENTYIVDSKIPLRITEIMYHPAEVPGESRYDADEFDFIEFCNVGTRPIDLTEIRLYGGVEFAFSESDIEILHPGEYLLLVENFNAFSSRYDAASLNIAGAYSGKLNNSGEDLILEGFLGEPILDFSYSDAWHPETDGMGHSLVIKDPLEPRDSWGDKENWAPSDMAHGSPGMEDSSTLSSGLMMVGDANQDGRLSLADPIILLRHLFSNETLPTPCDGDLATEGGNLKLYDLNGDGEINIEDPISFLNYLFLDGAPPFLGTGCVLISGCPDMCTP